MRIAYAIGLAIKAIVLIWKGGDIKLIVVFTLAYLLTKDLL